MRSLRYIGTVLMLLIAFLQGANAREESETDYSDGWIAYIDGRKTDIMRTNIGFCGLVLEPGEHEISMIYSTPGIKIGIIITILSSITYAIWIKEGYKRNDTKK